MCGIVGAVSARNIVPILIEGLRRLEYRGYDSCGVAVHQGGGCGVPAAPRASPSSRQRRAPSISTAAPASPTRAGRRTARRSCTTRTRTSRTGRGREADATMPRRRRSVGHRPPRPDRPGPQRDHREPRRAARRAASEGLRVRQADRHRGHRPPGRPASTTATCSRRSSARCRGCAAPTRSPCSAATSRSGSSARARARRWSSASARSPAPARTSSRRTRWRSPASPTRSSTSRTATSPTCSSASTGSPTPTPGRLARGRAGGAHGHRAHGRRRAGPVPPLHAEGDLRAAEGDRRHARRCRRRLGRSVRRRRAPRLQADRLGADPRLRHQLLQRLGRQVLAREHRRHPDPGRGRERVPLPRQRAEPAHAGRHDHAERRDRRHARGAEARALARHGAHADGLQRRDERDGARMRDGLHHARRRRDRRRLDEGLHHAARRPVPAHPRAGADARPPRRCRRGAAPEGTAPPAGRGAGGARARAADHRVERGVRAQGERALPRPRPALSDRARGRAEAEGDQLHPRRGLPGRRAEARPARAGDRADAGRRDRAERRAAREAESNLQEVRARGGELFVFADADSQIGSGEGVHVIRMPEHYGALSPILHVVPLQLLAYHTAWRAAPTSTSRGTWRRA